MAEIINDSPFTFPGVSDGGAHTKFFTGGAFTTDFLRWLVRDEQKITLEEAHYRLSALPAHAAGFRNRGMLREGAAADVVVYDLKGLDVDPDWVGEVVHDFPGGEWRRVQRAHGYRSIIVNGRGDLRRRQVHRRNPGPAAAQRPRRLTINSLRTHKGRRCCTSICGPSFSILNVCARRTLLPDLRD